MAKETETDPQVERVRVWPAEGVLVRDEVTNQPIEPGQEVAYTRAIARRLRDGDLLDHAPSEARERAVEQAGPQPERERAVVPKKKDGSQW